MPYADKEKRNERQRQVRKELKEKLVSLLGGSCEKCGSKDCLTIEHKEGRDYQVRKISSTERLRRYVRELESGVKLGILCLACNSAGGTYWAQFYAEKAQDQSTGQVFIAPELEPRDLEPQF